MKNLAFICLFFSLSITLKGQDAEDKIIRSIYDNALEKGMAYEDLRSLCKDIGARVTGSAEAEMAVLWGEQRLNRFDFDTVFLQAFKAPHWTRGTKEAAWAIDEENNIIKLNIIALGMSRGTDGLLEGDLIAMESPDNLKNYSRAELEGKIVFFTKSFDQKNINTFESYSGCIDQRWNGAAKSTQLGVKAVLIRSLAQEIDDHPHTGSMDNDDGLAVPAAALSTRDSEMLMNLIKVSKVRIRMDMDCEIKEDILTYNVIAEWKGEKDGIITLGGHLDSWDVGEGAQDDGAGVIHSMEALRLLMVVGHKPIHTMRCVFFMNEENGNFGGKAYAKEASDKKEEHLAAIESDRGAFSPIGFDVRGSEKQLKRVRSLKPKLVAYELHRFDPGYSGVDISPLMEFYPAMLQLGLHSNSQEYFNYHHAKSDVFETINKRELELGCAAMASMLYLLDITLQ